MQPLRPLTGGSPVFLLGGHDLEMLAIRELLEEAGVPYRDKALAWGAKASDYREEIAAIAARGDIPVLVELLPDLPLPAQAVLIDHHGERAGRDEPTSLEQAIALLGLPAAAFTRRRQLIAANDRGYLMALAALGASRDEMLEIRAADRAAQGVTASDEAAAREALAQHRLVCGHRLTVTDLPHARTSPLADLFEPLLGGPGYRNLLILSPEETSFFGEGAVVVALDREFPGGWYGGALPERGFWGLPRREAAVLDWLATQWGEDGDGR